MAVDYKVYAELSAEQIRKALAAHPRNVANLCRSRRLPNDTRDTAS